MSTALYRRYRPESFADVIGQEHVTGPLMQALRTGRVNHAYLFSGPRGCGKTTSARILARCLNCEQGPTPEPCGTCDSCVALARGGPGSVDVIEIDAASHGGVDDARDLRERASYGPAQSRFKVYIIDEAHMVTPQGFNALLKIVEEPPEHVKFVFATTEPEKVIGTIRSRTHHYPFRLVPPGQLQDYMERLCQQEGVAVAPGVLSFVVRAGGGSVRDSLSVLDQLIAGSGEAGLTYEGAAALLGFTDGELLDATIDAFAAGDAAGVFHQIDRVVESGLDPRRFVEDLLERLRDLIVVAAVPDGGASVLRQLPSDQLDRMRQQSSAWGPGGLSRAADIVNTGLTEMTGATAPRLQLELICARVLLPGASGEQGYGARLDRIERRLEVGGVPSAAAGRGGQVSAPAPTVVRQDVTAVRAPAGQAPAAVQAPAAAQVPTQAPAPVQGAAQGSARGPARPVAEPVAASSAEPVAEPTGAGPAAAARDSVLASAEPAAPAPAAPAASRAEPEDDGPEPVEDLGVAEEPAPSERTTVGGIDTAAIRRAWPDVLEKVFGMSRVTSTLISQNAHVLDYDGQRLLLGIKTSGLANTFRAGNHAELVRQALIDVIGVDVRVEGIPAPDAAPDPAAPSPTAAPTAPAAPAAPGSGPGAASGPSAAEQMRQERPTPTRPAPEDTTDWASAPAQGAPSWATEDDRPAPPTTGQAVPAAPAPAAEPEPAPPAPAEPAPSAGTGEEPAPADPEPAGSRMARARAALGASGPEEPVKLHVADDSAVSVDDEDIAEAGDVGRPVLERVFGARVVEEEGP